MFPLRIERAANDLLFDEEGRAYVDLFTAHGTTWLGHGHPAVTGAVQRQLGRVWCTGALETPALAEARALMDAFVPASHALAGLYSTGAEAAEFALRLARRTTGKRGAIGFERGMHGKTLAAAFLAWDNRDGVELPGFVRLPFPPAAPEEAILDRLARELGRGDVGAVFVEPVQGSGGGHAGTPAFYREVQRLSQAHGALLVFDEVLTGCYRTGPRFFFSDLGFVPDVVLLGKALGNGFPVSAVVADRRYEVRPDMLPGSTFAGNPLAAAAAAAVLRELSVGDWPGRVRRLEAVLADALAPLAECGVAVRGRGAMWILELPTTIDRARLAAALFRRGVAVGSTGRLVRLLPPATITAEHLERACAAIREEVWAAHRESGGA